MSLRAFALIRSVRDFPKKGIKFLDITPLLADGEVFKEVIRDMAAPWKDSGIKWVMASEARGFILGAAVAVELGAGFIPMRKPGKLPGETESIEYALEYGKDSLEMHKSPPFEKGRTLLVDDVLATGGTAEAMADLAVIMGADVEGFQFLLEIQSLGGRKRIENMSPVTLMTFP